ncbi:MAG TPA: cytochrome P450 [Crocinitomicaceae bacterium]|nr:cytochrome P450 [Crocinitomicaceae bacterium]
MFNYFKRKNECRYQIPDLKSVEFYQNFYKYYPLLQKKEVVYFKQSDCYGIFTFKLVKEILTDAERFSTQVLKIQDKILLGAENKTHTTNKKYLFETLSFLKPNGNDDELFSDIWSVLKENINKKNKFDIVQNLVEPFVFSYITRKLGIHKGFTDFDIFSCENPIQKTIENINMLYNDLSLIDEYVQKCIEENIYSNEFKKLIEKINVNQKHNTEELTNFLKLLILAGIETTSSFLASGLYCFFTNNSVQEVLLKNSVMWDSFFEEVLRCFSPAQFTFRTNLETIQISGIEIPKGKTIALSIGAANKDDNYFPNANEFILNRTNKHIAFGLSKHKCVGERLAMYIANHFFKRFMYIQGDIKYLNKYGNHNNVFSFRINQIIVEKNRLR